MAQDTPPNVLPFDGCSDSLEKPRHKEENLNKEEILTRAGKTIYPPTLEGLPIPERQWGVKEWLPSNCVTGLYGNGGVGKSLLAMMLMTSLSRGCPFLGMQTTQANAFGFFCEDSEEELHRRQNDINEHYGLTFRDLRCMAWQSRVGYDNILMHFSQGKGIPTQTYTLLYEEIRDIGASFVVIDTAADTFGGHENDRQEVRQYINLLAKMANDIKGSVLLCAHPSRSGITNKTGDGGSTAWNNTLRSRFYLRNLKDNVPIEDETDIIDNSGKRILQNMKSNYGPTGNSIPMVWKNGVFEPDRSLLVACTNPIKPKRPLGSTQQKILDALNTFNYSPVEIEDLCAATIKTMAFDSERDMRKQHFYQALNSSALSRTIGISENLVFKKS